MRRVLMQQNQRQDSEDIYLGKGFPSCYHLLRRECFPWLKSLYVPVGLLLPPQPHTAFSLALHLCSLKNLRLFWFWHTEPGNYLLPLPWTLKQESWSVFILFQSQCIWRPGDTGCHSEEARPPSRTAVHRIMSAPTQHSLPGTWVLSRSSVQCIFLEASPSMYQHPICKGTKMQLERVLRYSNRFH